MISKIPKQMQMPLEIEREKWIPGQISLAFCPSKSHWISWGNVKLDLILIGEWLAKCLLKYQGEFGFQRRFHWLSAHQNPMEFLGQIWNWNWLGIGLRNAIWNSKGKLGWNKFSLAFWSPKLPLIYWENIQLKQNPLGAWGWIWPIRILKNDPKVSLFTGFSGLL